MVQDNTAGIRVRPGSPARYSLYGHSVEVTGRTPTGPGEDSIIEATYRDLGSTSFPQPRLITVDDLQSSNLDGMLVTLRGITCPGHFNGEAEILFHTRLDGTVVQTSLRINDESAARSSYANADVEFTGVASTGFDVDGKVTSFELIVMDRRGISVKSAPLDFRSLPVRTVDELRNVGRSVSSLPFHLRGALRETATGWALSCLDSTGSIPLHVVDGSGYSKADVDVVGFLNRENSVAVLDEALVLGANDGATSGQVLTSADAVRKLSPDQARLKKPVSLDAIVTYNDPIQRIAFVQDQTAGAFVWSNDLNSRLLPGDRIKLEGFTGPGDFAPSSCP